ncbi:MAG: hypothetical protein AB7U82_22230 [Blastocatellales bacterium]
MEINWDNVDVEKMIFDLIEQRSPGVAERLLQMAARQAPLSELREQLQIMMFEDELAEDDYDTALIALQYARRYLSTPATGH